MKKEPWYNHNGVILPEREEQFDDLMLAIEELLRPFDGRVTYRDLYDLARDAAITAAGRLLIDHVNRPPQKKRKKL